MAEVIKLATSNDCPEIRACMTCRYSTNADKSFGFCSAVVAYIDFVRRPGGACGIEGKMWERKPEPTPRRPGVFEKIGRMLFGYQPQ